MIIFSPFRYRRKHVAAIVTTGLAIFAVFASTAGAESRPPSSLSLTITPIKTEGPIDAFKIDVEIRGDALASIETLSIYEDFGPLLHIGERISNLIAADAGGPIPMKNAVAELSDAPFVISQRKWMLARKPQAFLAYSYETAVSRETATGPVWELRSEERGASGSGRTFLVLPDSNDTFFTEIEWNLSALAAGTRSLSSFPSPDGARAEPLDLLQTAFFMAGDLVSNPADLAAPSSFKSASTTYGDIDQAHILDWTKRAYNAFIEFFDVPSEPPFTVFVRRNPFGGMGGTAFPDALVSTMSVDTERAEMYSLMAHEMAHVFLSGLTGEGGWFNEGVAVHYQRRLPLMAGLMTPEEFLDDLNDTTRRYYSNVRNDLPMKEAQDLFWFDARGRVLPYDRGALYFADIDAKLRVATNGERGLDHVIREILQRNREGGSVDIDGFLDILARDLGDSAREDYERMMAGALIVPSSDAFGPCFRREKKKTPSFELGFDIYSLMKTPRIIKDLDPNSPAAKAGLKEGDHVVNAMVLDAVQTNPSDPLTLLVERPGGAEKITFKPEGAPVTGYQWVRSENTPDDRCRY